MSVKYVTELPKINDLSEVDIYNRRDLYYYHKGLGKPIKVEFGSEVDNFRDVVDYEVVKL